jgi:cytochrome c553
MASPRPLESAFVLARNECREVCMFVPNRSLGLAIGLWTLVSLPAAAAPLEFNRDVRPILSDKCFQCHGPDNAHREAELRLDDEQNAKRSRDGSYAIAPGKPQQSLLIERITSTDDDLRMPPAESGKKLSAREIAVLRQWIAEGATYEAHWSYLPPKRTSPPPVKNASWPRGDIDRFILAQIEAAGLEPSPEADRATLARRLAFDLTGLPPTADETEAFVNDTSPAAYEKLVDRLLASHHYGERMAMYWFDLVRYANTVGYHGDQEHPITPYRDYVIKAFNDNLPFDRFTVEQLAGDLLPAATEEQKIASGYNRLLQTSHEGGVQQKEYLAKYSADRVRNVSQVWMGATMGCAECHDHKFDPYTQRDFYSLAAFFADVDDLQSFKGGDTTPTKRLPELTVLSPLDKLRVEQLSTELETLQQQAAAAGAASSSEDGELVAAAPEVQSRVKLLTEEIASLKKQTRRTMVTEAIEPRPIRVLNRGDWMDTKGEVVQPAVPQFLPRIDVTDRRQTRLDLARWLTSPEHPQTARVFVNRVWYLLFGQGLCRSLDDTGSQGQWPTHPALLDNLASDFARDWDVKRLVKQIVMSSAYRQSSLESDAAIQRDPENRLLARQSRFRLPAEMIRDQALCVSGLLVDRMGGPSAHPYQPDGYYSALNFPKRTYKPDLDENQYRRGVYVHWQRQYLHPMLKAFDAPSREECTAERTISNTPLAALTLLNDPTFVEAARVLAAGVLHKPGGSTADRIGRLWQSVLSRPAGQREVAAVEKLLESELAHYRDHADDAKKLLSTGMSQAGTDLDPVELAAWTSAARAVLNLNETITRN